MGTCLSVNNTIKPGSGEQQKMSSSRNLNRAKSSKQMINVKDFMGIKKSDSIDNFYKIDNVIGRGAFGEVVKSKHLFSNEERAIKIIDKKKLKKHSILQQLQIQELGVLMQSDHPSLMKVFEIVEDDGHYYIISELMNGGELYDRILQLKKFSEKDCANIIWQILRGLNYMHKRNIAHRDIKPENILMESKDTSNLNLKITDFGFAKSFDPNEGGLTETLGSPLYMAPEIIKKLPYNCAVDIWALGVLSYIMLSGKPPFKGRSKDEIFVQITTKNINYSGDVWKKISKEGKNFIKKMLIRNHNERVTAEDLLKDDWILNNLQQGEISESLILDVAHNLQQFQKNSVFQAGVMTYIVSQNENMQQLQQLKEVFNRFDESGDGYLELKEITAGLKEVLGHVKGSMQIFDDIMNSLDKNCNGVIDYTEFLTAASDKEALLSEQNLLFAFRMFDTDKNGSISKEELRQMFETQESKDEELWNDIFKEVDADGDGNITFEEFKGAMKKVVKDSSDKYLVRSDTNDKDQLAKQLNDATIKQMFVDPQQGI